jgi:3-oxoacyl-[acyl-carrier protein] reductase
MNQRCALVTGASRGIGADIAGRLAVEGYNVTLAARREPALTSFADGLRSRSSVDVHPVVANLAVEDDVRRLADEHLARYGRLDVLVLNAGLGSYAPLGETPLKTFDLTFGVNVRSAFVLIQELLPLLRKTAALAPERGAKVIALASIAGVYAEAGMSVYGASKSALISLCETLTAEERGNGVTATALSPGFVDTDMTAWTELPGTAMLSTADVAELALAITRLSANAAVGNVVIARGGTEPRRP